MVGLTEGDTTRRLFADLVSSNYFDTMGVRCSAAAYLPPKRSVPAAICRW